jgi:LysM repeat protein
VEGKQMNKKLIKIVSVAFIFLFPVMIMAQEISSSYIVKPGDTLWDISADKLKDPFLWKKLWITNIEIRNPHLIFPGQKLIIPQDMKVAEQQEIKDPRAGARLITSIKLQPSAILQKEYLISREDLLYSGYIADAIVADGAISSISGDGAIVGKGDKVYITSPNPINLHDKFYVVEKSKAVLHPIDNSFVGYIIRIKGVVEVIGEDDGTKKALVLEAFKEIAANDILINYYEVEPPMQPDKDRMPNMTATGVAIWKDYTIGGKSDIVYFDKGARDGVMQGDMFKILSIQKPPRTIGTAQVFTVKDKTSVALIKKAEHEIMAGNLIKN